MLQSMVASADTVEINGIKYNVIKKAKTAEVIANNYQGSIEIPPSIDYEGIPCIVKSIGNSAFKECGSLSSVIIPSSVTTIGESAFSQCKFTSISLPNSITSIGSKAFYACSSLTEVIIPNSITEIKESTFDSCSRLTSITIPNSVTSIGEYNQEIEGETNVEIIPVSA